jgi:cell division protein FtsW
MSMSVGVGIMLTGQPLPLISRGGSSIIITSAYIGIILSISRLDSPEEGPEWQTSRSVAEQMRRELAEQENNQIEQSL